MQAPDIIDAIGDPLEGSWGTAPRSAETEATALFNRYYEERFGEPPPMPFMYESYDAAFAIALAIEKAGEATGPAIRSALRDVANPPGEIILPGEWAKAVQLIRAGQESSTWALRAPWTSTPTATWPSRPSASGPSATGRSSSWATRGPGRGLLSLTGAAAPPARRKPPRQMAGRADGRRRTWPAAQAVSGANGQRCKWPAVQIASGGQPTDSEAGGQSSAGLLFAARRLSLSLARGRPAPGARPAAGSPTQGRAGTALQAGQRKPAAASHPSTVSLLASIHSRAWRSRSASDVSPNTTCR